jgi:dienelactone hydrolase
MVREAIVDDIPVLFAVPPEPRPGLVLWLPYLGAHEQRAVPTLERCAAAGHAAVSFVAPGHGSRGGGDPMDFARDVLADFRRRMWPLLGLTTLEALRVLDWAFGEVPGARTVLAGGLSMGGDVAIALAGIDERVRRVVAIGSTPDWSRPGMRELSDPSRLVDQGEADRYARWFADQFDPMRHLDRYRSGVEIAFELGAEDRHIPESNAWDFAAALSALDPEAGARVRIRTHPGLAHGVISDDAVVDAAVDWLLAS